jgi:lisH domain-containing protein FOPNL
MANVNDLKDALRDVLDQRGVLDQIKARIRAEVFSALDEQTEPKPQPSNINLVLNELIREYMEFNRYRHSLAVFLPETGQPAQPPFEREFLAQQLNVPDNEQTVKIPLLYNIVALLQQSAAAENSSAAVNSQQQAAIKSPLASPNATKGKRPIHESDAPAPITFSR